MELSGPTHQQMTTVIFILAFLPSAHAYCDFPSMLYGRTQRWQMFGNGGEPFEMFGGSTFPHHRKMSFDSYFITVFYPDPLTVAYYLTCHETDDNHKFLVNLLDHEATSRGFLCMEIIIESSTVVRFRTSSLVPKKSSTLCSTATLTPSPAPLLYFTKDDDFWKDASLMYSRYNKCPIEGGFIAKWVDSSGNGTRGCSSKWPIRFEAECAQGTGLGFSALTRSDPCQLPIIADGRGFDYCLATWTNANDTFFISSLMTPDEKIPCFRFKTQHDPDDFTLYLFMDGVCDITEDLSSSKSVIEISLKRFQVADVCSDLSPECLLQNTTACPLVGINDITCRGACHICPDIKPWSRLFFDEKFKGVWIQDTKQDQQQRLIIDDKFFQLGSIGYFENFGLAACSQGPTPRMYQDMGVDIMEYVIMVVSDKGCAPRVATIQISRRSTSVLSYRISRSVPLRIESSHLDVDPYSGSLKLVKDFDHWCIQADYVLYGPPPVYSMYRSYTTGWYNVISAQPPSTLVPCTFPTLPLSLHIHSYQGTLCTATLTPKGETDLIFSIMTCRNKTDQGMETGMSQSGLQLSCLASFAGTANRQFLITQVQTELESYPAMFSDRKTLCWMYNNVTMTGLWYTVSDCDSSVDSSVTADQYRQALAEFNATLAPLVGGAGSVWGPAGTCMCALSAGVSLLVLVGVFL